MQSSPVRVKLIKPDIIDPRLPVGATGTAKEWKPPGMLLVDWDFYHRIPMYYHEVELIGVKGVV